MVFDQTGVVDIEAAGGAVSRNVEQRVAPTMMLPPEQRILQEDDATEEGGSRTREPSGA